MIYFPRAGRPVFMPCLVLLMTGILFLSAPATAQDTNIPEGKAAVTDTATPDSAPKFQGLIPPAGSDSNVTYGGARMDSEDTHAALRLTPDKSALVRLEEDASSVIVGNPEHLGVLMDDSRLLILVPRQPGATYLTVLNKAGKMIMQRHVIVTVANKDYLRIRRSCNAGAGDNCAATSVYYCDGMCHEVSIVENDGNASIPPPLTTVQRSGEAPADTGGVQPVPPATQEPAPQDDPEDAEVIDDTPVDVDESE